MVEATVNGWRLINSHPKCKSEDFTTKIWPKTVGSGNAAIDLKHRTFIVDNVSNGFDLYKLDTGHFLRTLVTKDPIKTYPKGVAFANKCQAVVGGSDHGHVYIFERKTGKVIQTIKHARDGGVQTIAVRLARILISKC